MHTLSKEKIANLLTPVIAVMIWLVTMAFSPAVVKADVVSDWNQIADTAVVTNAQRPNAASLIDMAYVNAAIYDAVNAIDRTHTVYAVKPENIPAADTSKDAAAAAAAYKVLLRLFPAQEGFLTGKYTQYLATIPESSQKTAGIALGSEIGTKFMNLREGDGRNGESSFTPWNAATGSWQPTMPDFTPTPVTPWMATMRPFLMDSPSQFRADGPPALDSKQWADDYNETILYGAVNSTVRTPEQTKIGLFYTEHTGAQYNRIFRQFAAEQRLSTVDNARLFAMLYLSIADSLIAAWDSKYYFHFWRPVTAIRAGDSDNNSLTKADANWLPLAVTPGHPEYPAAHGSMSAAYAEALRAFFGTKNVHITLSSTVTNSSKTFDNTDDIIKEIIDARIFGGMHYRTSGVHGSIIGKRVTQLMSRKYFQPVRR